jgi:predicted nucleic acid-binding Zn finger protein
MWLTLLSIEAGDKSAVFIVNGTREDVVLEDTFGTGEVFTYVGTVTKGGRTCAEVTYVDEELPAICPGEQKDVS